MELVGSVVQVLTEQACKVGAKHVHYASDFRAQLDHLKQFLKHVNGILDDKDNLKDMAADIKPALIPLRKLIYEASDIITDCLLRDEYNAGGLSGLLQRCNVVFLLDTGKKLKDINSKLDNQIETLDKILNLKKKLREPPKEVRPTEANQDDNNKEIMSQDYSPNKAIGIDEDIKKIKAWILEPKKRELHRVAVTGMGGLGKTTIAQKIYCDNDVSRCFNRLIWVSVSKNFNRDRILRTMLKKLIGGEMPKLEYHQLLGEIRREIEKKNGCLVVMDDVWRIDDVVWWNDLCSTFDVQNQRNCIMVTTRSEDVAGIFVRGEECRIHRPKTLNDEESWELFSQFAFPGAEFKEIGKKIVKKCGGLPLSIKTIGSLLAAKTKLSAWTEVSENFRVSPIKGNDQVIESLRLSYNDLEGHLKHCLLCFSIYPEDSEISAEQIIHWWAAEGLLQKRDSKSAMDVGREYLSVLASRCLVEVEKCRPYDGKVYSCKIHDMVRELVMMIAQEEGFCSFNDQGIMIRSEDTYWLCLTDDVLGESDEGTSKDNEDDEGKSKDKCLSFDNNSKIRALLLMTSQHIDLNINSGLLLSLRMLDLSGGSINLDKKRLKNLLDWIGALTRLAGLNLSELGLEELPSSICKLRNLQLLVLTGCSNLNKISESIAKLKKLMVLHLGNCRQLEYLPLGLEKLSNLQELNGFKVMIGRAKSKARCGLLELRNLTQLTVLQIVITSDNEAEILESTDQWKKTLSGLANLKTLDIDTENFKNGLPMLHQLYPPKSLRELYLRNYHLNKLPEWIHPSKLTKLQYLCIEDASTVTNWIDPPNAEWKFLEGLRLKDMQNLKADWTEMKKAMPALRYMEVIKCDKLEKLPQDQMRDNIWRSTRTRR